MTRATRRTPRIENILPLTPLQEGLLFHAAYDDAGSARYNVQVALDLEGPLDVPVLRRSVEAVVRRHPTLRASFRRRAAGDTVQVIQSEVATPWEEHDLTAVPDAEPATEAERITRRAREGRFDLAAAPLVNFTLIRLRADGFRLVLTNHHIVLDGWSTSLLLRELFTVYGAGGDASVLPPPVSPQAFFAWRGEQDAPAAREAWRAALDGLAEATRVAPYADSHTATATEQIVLTVPEELTAAVGERARGLGLTLSTVVQGTWGLLLSRLTGADDVVFGTTVSGRAPELPDVESVIGMLVNTVPVRVRTDGAETLAALYTRLQQEQSELVAHHQLGLTEIQSLTDIDGELFDTLVVFENYPVDRAVDSVGGVRVTGTEAHNTVHYPLSLLAHPGDRLVLHLGYRSDVLTGTAARRVGDRVLRLLRLFAEAADTRVDAVDLLGDDERGLLAEWNDTGRPVPRRSVAELFASQAAAGPGRTAIRYGGLTTTYQELDDRANRLASDLTGRGIGPEDVVALALPRSTEMIVSLLAVLKAGAAYLPIDPAYPRERIEFMLTDARPVLLITTSDTAERLGTRTGTARLLVDGPRATEGIPR
ncbi:condensation domain-containing protein [Streptomyces pseudovenezuelae]|uniref:Condensation domain-containing protein n=1 Tax=Streptomyces pseudovenezuelae TaxID=67350 RepID=A0ABZ1WRE9_9ACTN|nr:condensation domain-containing protein [Streptomyces pseudovenezuelae]